MNAPSDPRWLLAVSLKAYLGFEETLRWVSELRDRLLAAPIAADVELAVLPSSPLLDRAARELASCGVSIGAQDVSRFSSGPYTGEVTASTLAEIGCRYAEIGHAERRRLLGEDAETVRLKASAAACHGLIPLICVGESQRTTPSAAAKDVVRQLDGVLSSSSMCEPVVAYEPEWAIGSALAADPDHVREVGRAIRAFLAESGWRARLLYGGAAGPGTLSPLSDEFDGLFLGRRAHRIDALLTTIEEAAALSRGPSALGPAR